jgi:hypothetical protein
MIKMSGLRYHRICWFRRLYKDLSKVVRVLRACAEVSHVSNPKLHSGYCLNVFEGWPINSWIELEDVAWEVVHSAVKREK